MSEELSDTLKIGRLEDKFNLYEPLFISLQGIVSIPNEITRIQDDLQRLRDSRVAVREQLTTLFKSQDRVYKDMVKSLEKQTRVLEKEIEDCPIADLVPKVATLERDMDLVDTLDGRLKVAEDTIDSFKLKGWDLWLRVTPWMLATATTAYAVLK